ncbi:hypothetical protein [Alteromonas gilva]|uniref:Peptidase M61 n=1 Tax=Alteromonas gilva TaxID=2987522 RepID=A0ABT5L6A5_9ALTE|nr:hypothetical protein [Alteromonas gilva]MDC8831906.1 hypothetical protein [Alteromonas gilva]
MSGLGKSVWAVLMIGCVLIAAPCSAQQPDFPDMQITIEPVMQNNSVEQVNMVISFDSDSVAAGEPLLSMPVVLVSTPSANLHAADLHVTDEQGALTLSERLAEPDPSGQYREYITERATQGRITVSYDFTPRAVDELTRNGPLFDFRRQTGGAMGAGVYFMVLPTTKTPYNISLNWQLDNLPAAVKGVWSYGEGSQRKIGPVDVVRFSFYAVGALKQYPQTTAQYTQYWLNPPPFDMTKLARKTQTLFEHMAAFFGDTNAFKVFARANPYPAGGGTGLGPSFMFGYGREGQTTDGGTDTLLSHELAHTWPRLNNDEPHALTAWYTEGMAEFYSLLMLRRSGAMETDEFVRQLNQRMDNYYGSRFLTLTNAEAGELFWQEHDAQRVPYGRGLVYLLKLDQQLKDASQGEVSLDTLVLDVYNRQQAGETIGLDAWQAMLRQHLGERAVEDFIAMTNGKVMTPEPRIFGCLVARPYQFAPFELGFDPMRLGEVSDLRADSNAANAGLQNGDIITAITPVEVLKKNPQQKVEMTVTRGDNTFDVSFLPRRAPVSGWHWVRDTTQQCAFKE